MANENKKSDKKTHWSSHLIFVLACIGSAIGVGNIWRFPYLAGENGGGTFILVYLFCVLCFGLPILMLELIIGKAFASSPLKALEKIKKQWLPAYYANFILIIILFSYYMVVTGWTLGYLSISAFHSFKSFDDFSNSYLSLAFALIVLAILLAIMRLDIKDGLEKVNAILPPLLFAILLVLLYYAYSMPAFGKAVTFYTNVDLSKIANPGLWVAVLSQVMFSLSIGLGMMMAYGAYLHKKEEIFKSSIAIAIADTAASLIAALVIFGFVFSFNIPPNSGPALTFEALPLAFQQMPAGWLLMPLFFLLLFGAAITSAVAIAEVVIRNFQDMFGLGRKKATVVCIALITVLMIPSALSYSPIALSLFGEKVLDFLDGKVVERLLPFATFILVSYLAWGYKNLEKEFAANIPSLLVGPFMVLVKYIIPVLLLALSILQFI